MSDSRKDPENKKADEKTDQEEPLQDKFLEEKLSKRRGNLRDKTDSESESGNESDFEIEDISTPTVKRNLPEIKGVTPRPKESLPLATKTIQDLLLGQMKKLNPSSETPKTANEENEKEIQQPAKIIRAPKIAFSAAAEPGNEQKSISQIMAEKYAQIQASKASTPTMPETKANEPIVQGNDAPIAPPMITEADEPKVIIEREASKAYIREEKKDNEKEHIARNPPPLPLNPPRLSPYLLLKKKEKEEREASAAIPEAKTATVEIPAVAEGEPLKVEEKEESSSSVEISQENFEDPIQETDFEAEHVLEWHQKEVEQLIPEPEPELMVMPIEEPLVESIIIEKTKYQSLDEALLDKLGAKTGKAIKLLISNNTALQAHFVKDDEVDGNELDLFFNELKYCSTPDNFSEVLKAYGIRFIDKNSLDQIINEKLVYTYEDIKKLATVELLTEPVKELLPELRAREFQKEAPARSFFRIGNYPGPGQKGRVEPKSARSTLDKETLFKSLPSLETREAWGDVLNTISLDARLVTDELRMMKSMNALKPRDREYTDLFWEALSEAKKTELIGSMDNLSQLTGLLRELRAEWRGDFLKLVTQEQLSQLISTSRQLAQYNQELRQLGLGEFINKVPREWVQSLIQNKFDLDEYLNMTPAKDRNQIVEPFLEAYLNQRTQTAHDLSEAVGVLVKHGLQDQLNLISYPTIWHMVQNEKDLFEALDEVNPIDKAYFMLLLSDEQLITIARNGVNANQIVSAFALLPQDRFDAVSRAMGDSWFQTVFANITKIDIFVEVLEMLPEERRSKLLHDETGQLLRINDDILDSIKTYSSLSKTLAMLKSDENKEAFLSQLKPEVLKHLTQADEEIGNNHDIVLLWRMLPSDTWRNELQKNIQENKKNMTFNSISSFELLMSFDSDLGRLMATDKKPALAPPKETPPQNIFLRLLKTVFNGLSRLMGGNKKQPQEAEAPKKIIPKNSVLAFDFDAILATTKSDAERLLAIQVIANIIKNDASIKELHLSLNELSSKEITILAQAFQERKTKLFPSIEYLDFRDSDYCSLSMINELVEVIRAPEQGDNVINVSVSIPASQLTQVGSELQASLIPTDNAVPYHFNESRALLDSCNKMMNKNLRVKFDKESQKLNKEIKHHIENSNNLGTNLAKIAAMLSSEEFILPMIHSELETPEPAMVDKASDQEADTEVESASESDLSEAETSVSAKTDDADYQETDTEMETSLSVNEAWLSNQLCKNFEREVLKKPTINDSEQLELLAEMIEHYQTGDDRERIGKLLEQLVSLDLTQFSLSNADESEEKLIGEIITSILKSSQHIKFIQIPMGPSSTEIVQLITEIYGNLGANQQLPAIQLVQVDESELLTKSLSYVMPILEAVQKLPEAEAGKPSKPKIMTRDPIPENKLWIEGSQGHFPSPMQKDLKDLKAKYGVLFDEKTEAQLSSKSDKNPSLFGTRTEDQRKLLPPLPLDKPKSPGQGLK